MADARELCDVADVTIEVEDDAFEWPEDVQTLGEKLEHIAVSLECGAAIHESERAPFAAVIREAAELGESHKRLLAEAPTWDAEDETGEAVDEQFCAPAFRAYRDRLRKAIREAEKLEAVK